MVSEEAIMARKKGSKRQDGGRSRKLRDHLFKHKNEAESNWKWEWRFKNPMPTSSSSEAAPPTPSQTVPTMEKQVCKCPTLQGTFLIQTTIDCFCSFRFCAFIYFFQFIYWQCWGLNQDLALDRQVFYSGSILPDLAFFFIYCFLRNYGQNWLGLLKSCSTESPTIPRLYAQEKWIVLVQGTLPEGSQWFYSWWSQAGNNQHAQELENR